MVKFSRKKSGSSAAYHSTSISAHSGGEVGLRCPGDHVLNVGSVCDVDCHGWPDDDKCRRETLPPSLRSISHKCEKCEYELCQSCYEAKSHGTSDG